MVSKATPTTTYNIVAKLVGWGAQGVANVQVLTSVPGAPAGTEIQARVAEDRKRLKMKDFKFWKDKGLRVGGVVLLRWSVIDPELGIVCKEMDMMRKNEKDGPCLVKPNSAVYLHAPETVGSYTVSHATIAVVGDAKKVKKVDQCVTFAKRMIEDTSILGKASLLLTVADASGRIEELPINIPEKADADAVEKAVRSGIDPESAKLMATSPDGWWLVPMFDAELETDPYIQGKHNAQYVKIKYGPFDEPMFTRTNVVLRGSFSDFIIADVSPASEPQDIEPRLLVDLLG
ncbi:hypothetical protein [Rhizobium sp. BK176]|uniref:hypothetical protein n=1 Tax=Rhizobium sp. BK176 TaxID=2587071 RepID=UPI0021692DB5|nr:hypothetical protein [Rhizobium sp. BK176]MCS4089847.1 hypothetical protein [Rhizobium sp. BK176]